MGCICREKERCRCYQRCTPTKLHCLRNHPIFSYEVYQRCYLLFFLVLTWEADLDLKRSVTIIQKEKDRTKEGGDDGPGG